MTEPASLEPHILELRIHGVANTPPVRMLGLSADEIEQSDGDDLGAFWTPKEEALLKVRERASRRWVGELPSNDEWVPPEYVSPTVRREAYSWGAMARSSGLPSAPNLAVRAARAGWLLLAPFGILNSAYWSRQLIPDEPRQADGSMPKRRYARGRIPILLFGVGLTLLLVAALQTVGLDLVASQCADSGRCPDLPGWMTGLAGLEWSRRVAVMSLLPVAGLFALLYLSSQALVHYDLRIGPQTSEVHDRPTPVLSQRDLWTRWRFTERAANAHIAAGLALITMTVSAARLWSDHSCTLTPNDFSLSCIDPARWSWLYAISWVLAAGLMVVSLVLVVIAPPRRQGSTQVRDNLLVLSWWVLSGAGVLLLIVDANLWLSPVDPAHATIPGSSAIPDMLIGILLLTALTAFTWRRSVRTMWVSLPGALAIAIGEMVNMFPNVGAHNWPTILAVAGFLWYVVVVASGARRWAGNSHDPATEAWWGGAPGVLLLLALGLQMTLVSVLVIGVGDWLNGDSLAWCLAGESSCANSLVVPGAYRDFAAGISFGILLTALSMVQVVVRLLARRDLGEPPIKGSVLRQRAGSMKELLNIHVLVAAVLRARRRSDLLQRGESLIGAVSWGLGMALALTMLFMPMYGWFTEWPSQIVGQATVAGIWIIATGWTAGLVAMVVTGDQSRPLGVLWDLLCFLPRSAHPLGPPSYAERAVPEIAARIDAWLAADDLPPGAAAGRHRMVVLSPHSLGSMLAVAALMLPSGREQRQGRVALLSYGTQIRTYFGRFFPEVFGPAAMGIPPVCAPTSTAPAWSCIHDLAPRSRIRRRPGETNPQCPPVSRQEPCPMPSAISVGPTLVELLAARDGASPYIAPLWRSLWRPTDHLGMRVGIANVDTQTEEIDAAGYLPAIAAHSGYPRSPQYRESFDVLVRRLSVPAPRPEGVKKES